MYRFTDAELTMIQTYLDKARQDLATAGLRVKLESDLDRWVALMENAPKIVAVSPSFDPRYSHLHPGNSFWLNVCSDGGRIAACICFRLFVTDDIIGLIRPYQLFFNKLPVLDYRPLTLVTPNNAPVIGGRVSYGGGLWVHPDYRGIGLDEYVPRLGRALSLRHFDVGWNFALAAETEKRLDLARNTFGVKNRFPCLRGYFPPNDTDGYYQVVYLSRQELLNQMADDAATLPRLLCRRRPGTVSRARRSANQAHRSEAARP